MMNCLVNIIYIPIFALPATVLQLVKYASSSRLRKIYSVNDNTPPMPLFDAHLGGLFFLSHE